MTQKPDVLHLQSEQKLFRQGAREGNSSSTPDIQQERMEYFLDFIRDKKDCRVLDIGCQSGSLCHQLKQCGHEPYGVDIVEELIQKARGTYPQITFECVDCEKGIPFDDNFFDVVWAGDVIEHICFTDVFVNEINRILKIGGLFVLTTPMHNRLKNVIISLYNFEKHFDPEFPHLRFYTLKSLQTVLEKRGFRIESVQYIGRISPLAKSMFVVCEKKENKQLLSEHRF